jgi:hypothetical protein
MAQYFSIHPVNPQQRLIREAAAIVRNGGVIAYPTDSATPWDAASAMRPQRCASAPCARSTTSTT